METYAIKNLSFFYPESSNPALENIDLTIPAGQFITLCGSSGSGKTTLLRHLKSVLTPHGVTSGEIYYEGQPLENVDWREQTARIGFVLQNPDNQIVTDKVWHELAFGLESLGYDSALIRLRVAEMASFFGIQTWFHRNVTELSGGQKQLLNLAAVIAMQPRVLVLDEPTSQLDPIAASGFLGAVQRINRELGITVIMSEHRLEEVFPMSDRVLVMQEGQIIAGGSPQEVGMELKRRHHRMFAAMPAPMRIYAGVENDLDCPVTVREGRAWLDRVFCPEMIGKVQNTEAQSAPGSPTLPQTPMLRKQIPTDGSLIEFKNVWFRYNRNGDDAVRDLSFSVRAGEFLALTGGNGAGKTTTLALLSGIIRPYRGSVGISRIEAGSIAGNDRFHVLLGCLPQNPQTLFVKANVAADLHEMLSGMQLDESEKSRRVARAVQQCMLESLLERHPYDLSVGEQQRAALAKVLLLNPRILLLDEPTKGLDSKFKEQLAVILKNLQASGTTIVMVSHDIEFCARHASRCALLFDGSIVSDGKPAAFFGGNSFYTTAANRMARHLLPGAITAEDVITACGGQVPSDTDGLPAEKPASLPAESSSRPAGHARLLGSRPEKWLSPQVIAAVIMILIAIPLTVWAGMYFLDDRKYYFISLLVVLETMLPFALIFESRRPQARELVLIAALCAIGVAGRAAFFMLPEIKPVIAIVVITGVCLGGEAGFLVGALTAFVSDCFFGQGPWTPWQMFCLGTIGFLAGIMFKKGLLPRRKLPLCVFGALTALVIYGGLMNPASVLIYQPHPTMEMFWLAYVQGIPFDLVHATATAFFLFLIAGPMIEKLERIKLKYGLIEP